MTDEQLIELVQTASPEELRHDQIELIRRRLAKSPALRTALGERLEMEQWLRAAIGPSPVSIDAIVARGRTAALLRNSGLLPLLGWALCLALVTFVGLVLILAIVMPPSASDRREQRAQVATMPKPDAPKRTVENVLRSKPPRAGQAPPLNDSKRVTQVSTPAPLPPAIPINVSAKPAEPWSEVLAAKDAPPDSPLQDVLPRAPAPGGDGIKRWFETVPGQGGNISARDYENMRCGVLEGLVRLRAPWTDGTALRLALYEHYDLRIFFWSGSQGVMLRYYEYANRTWVAYSTTRRDGQPRPITLALAASDEDRYWRTNPEPPAVFELRATGGQVVLSRGDVRIVAAALPGPISDVFIEGHVIVRHISLVRAGQLSADRGRATIDLPPPADWSWLGELPAGAQFDKLPNGGVQLAAEKNSAPAWVAVRSPRAGLFEWIVQLDGASPGTGVYLGDADGQPKYLINFFRERRTGFTSLGMIGYGDGRLESDHDYNQQPTPFVSQRPWLKLVFGCGSLKCSLSDDGVNWGRAFEPARYQREPCESFGLYASPAAPRRTIRLGKLALRDFPRLNGLVPGKLLAKAIAAPRAADLGQWLETILSAQPSSTDTAAWRRACAIRTLARGAPVELAAPLLDNLLEDGLHGRGTPQDKLALVDEACVLADTWDNGDAALGMARQYERIGRAALPGEPRPYSLVRHAQLTAPIWSRQMYNFMPDALIRTEMLQLLSAGRWEELSEFCRQQRFWRRLPRGQQPALVDWASATAAHELPKQSGVIGTGLPADWRHPLQIEVSKEGFNMLADLQAALAGKAYQDACQIVTAADSAQTIGLLPDAHDTNLHLALPGVVTLAMREHAPLRTAMVEQFGPLGKLRVRQAIDERDQGAIDAIAVQFPGTAAAAEAHLWLGDRALADGQLFRALGHYRKARESAPAELADRIAVGQQLAAALLGQPAGKLPVGQVTLGDTRLTPVELAALTSDLRRRVGEGSGAASAGAVTVQRAPALRGFEAVTRGRFDGDAGENPQHVPGELNEYDVDWVARQMAVSVDGERVIFSNRFQVSAWNVSSGQWQWRVGLGGEQAHAHEWRLMPMRPTVTADRVFVRRLVKQGPQLAAIDKSTGRLIWTSKPRNETFVVSDPVFVEDQLLALTMTRVEQDFDLALCGFDADSGDVLFERPLARVRESWWSQRTCQAAIAGDSLIVTLAGSVLSCDLSGNVRWARRQTWLPPALDSAWPARCQQPPLVAGGRVFVVQPSVPAVECLDVENGRLIWRAVLPQWRRLLALLDDRLLVQTDQGVWAIDAATGQPRWEYPAGELLDGYLCGSPGGLLLVRRETPRGQKESRPVLAWVDPATSREKARAPLDGLRHEKPRLGPLFVANDRLWALFGRGMQEAHRDIVELVPRDQPQPPATVPNTVDRWTRHVDASLRQAGVRLFPGWTLLDAKADEQTGIVAEWQGERDVLVTAAGGGRPTRIARRFKLPTGSRPKLNLRVSSHPDGKWKLDVQLAGKQIAEEQIDRQSTGGSWKNVEVDLAPYAGQTVWVVVRQHDVGGPNTHARWKRLEVTY